MRIKLQNDINDCGISVVQALAYFFHEEWIDESTIKLKSKLSSKGINANNLIRLASEFGIKLEPFEVSSKDLFTSHLDQYMVCLFKSGNEAHYVIAKMLGRRILIIDPTEGKYKISKKEFEKSFLNFIFIPSKIKLNYKILEYKNPWSLLENKSKIIIHSVIANLFIISITLISTLFMKIIMDKIIPGNLSNTLTLLVVIFSVIAVIKISFSRLNEYFRIKISIMIESELLAIFIDKYKNAYISEINKLSTNEYISRMFLIKPISDFISNVVLTNVQNILMIFICSIVMIWISVDLLIMITLMSVVLIFSAFIIFKISSHAFDDFNQQSISDVNNKIQLLLSKDQLKNEDYSEWSQNKLWRNYFLLNKSEVKIWSIGIINKIIGEIITGLSPILITYIFVMKIFSGNLSPGGLLMFMSLSSIFISSSSSIASSVIQFQTFKKNVDLLKYILIMNEETYGKIKIDKIKTVALSNATFGYDKPIFRIENFIANKNIHLIGKNGSGKTSLLKIIAGLLYAEKEIEVNNIKFNQLDIVEYRKKIFYSSPDNHFPNTSILEYITLDNEMAINQFNKNYMKYSINNVLNDLSLSLDMSIMDNGSNLSSGQKQFISLLRLFAFNYDVIILDEAIENLDDSKISWFKESLKLFNEKIFLEISHSKKYISKGEEVKFENVVKSFH